MHSSEKKYLLELAKAHRIKAHDLAFALEISHDRLNGGGLAEVIEVALTDDDDASFLREVILAFGSHH